ncbi:glycosyltransferase family 92 protein RCOM_0530710-like [Apium graveolens]|uniref:glycosyltransferase family 92 protein RCOM_0530710-like n=1 Tax=Apium graveolens TaxID=4045 RepID=UPI003D7917F4
MSRKLRSTLFYLTVSLLFLVSLYYNIFRTSLSDDNIIRLSPSLDYNHHFYHQQLSIKTDSLSAVTPPSTISTFSVLLPAWQVLVVISPEITPFPPDSGDFFCLFSDNEISPARASGTLPSPERSTFSCELPVKLRRKTPFPEPVLIKSPAGVLPAITNSPSDMLRWNYLVYEATFTENDVVVFAKGVNKRQGKNWEPWEFNCVFGDDVANGVRTTVTSSAQEVFRCQLPPDLTSLSSPLIKVSLEFSATKRLIPSIAYATPTRMIRNQKPKSLICACTMVYNVAKFLREWIIYHSKIGVDRFILYDNVSEDEFNQVVTELIDEGYNISTKFWQWPKTQEAGFSHCAIDNRDTCTWMMYVDVDEFVYSNSWSDSTGPMLKSLLPTITKSNLLAMSNSQVESGEGNMYANDLLANPSYYNKVPPQVGEIMIGCHEFGPSNQKSHPVEGVLQGYDCRKKMENRHKSIVLLDAIRDSLVNVVHHFHLKEGYKMIKIDVRSVVVNHYKFQAWPEFKAKFKRRVSAYVADWTESVNPNSQDRTPGLGFAAVEPQGWPQKFCEVHDNGLKMLSEKWFGNTSQLRTSYTPDT